MARQPNLNEKVLYKRAKTYTFLSECKADVLIKTLDISLSEDFNKIHSEEKKRTLALKPV